MKRRLCIALCATLLCAISAEASADLLRNQRKEIAEKAVSRVRRSISFGATGGAGLSLASEGGTDGVFSFGLGFFWFKDPFFDIGNVREGIQKRFQKKLIARLLELGLTEKDLTGAELARLKKELWIELEAELRAQLYAKPSSTPNPRLNLYLEGGYLMRAEAWQVRAGLGVGVSKLTLGPTLVGNFGDAKAFGVGLEAAFHYLVGSGNRPLGLQLFLRYDYFVNSRDVLGHQGALGIRTFFDII